MGESTTPVPRVPDPALDRRMAQYEGLVGWVVRRQWRGALSFDDALHAGRIGLWHALRGYDPTRATRFSTYAVPAIARAVWEAVATVSPAPLPPAAAVVEPVDDADPDEALHQAQVRQALHALVATLPTRLRDVLIWHYGLAGTLPQTFAQIGRREGISRQRVHQLHRQALLVLAHPARSHALLLLVDRQQRRAYQRTLARQRQHARAHRRCQR